ncbi:MAG: hypothetical protein H7834_13545 [Magnetococcus sp. YQC-9]
MTMTGWGHTQLFFNKYNFIKDLNRTHSGMRSFSQGCVQDAGVVSKKRKRPPPRRRAAHFSRKGAKNASFEERAQGKVKTLGEESPIYGPPRFARKNFHRVNQRKVASIYSAYD